MLNAAHYQTNTSQLCRMELESNLNKDRGGMITIVRLENALGLGVVIKIIRI